MAGRKFDREKAIVVIVAHGKRFDDEGSETTYTTEFLTPLNDEQIKAIRKQVRVPRKPRVPGSGTSTGTGSTGTTGTRLPSKFKSHGIVNLRFPVTLDDSKKKLLSKAGHRTERAISEYLSPYLVALKPDGLGAASFIDKDTLGDRKVVKVNTNNLWSFATAGIEQAAIRHERLEHLQALRMSDKANGQPLRNTVELWAYGLTVWVEDDGTIIPREDKGDEYVVPKPDAMEILTVEYSKVPKDKLSQWFDAGAIREIEQEDWDY